MNDLSTKRDVHVLKNSLLSSLELDFVYGLTSYVCKAFNEGEGLF